MSAELAGAKQNAELVRSISNPMSAQHLLAEAMLLLIQHLEKHA